MMKKVFLPFVVIGYPIKILLGRGIKAILALGLLLIVTNLLLTGLFSILNLPFTWLILNLVKLYLFVGFIYTVSTVWKDEEIDNGEVHGKSKFASLAELKSVGLVGNGIVLGKKDGELIEKPSTKEGHTLIIGGTGTGKGRGHAIPTLLRWNGTGLIVDIKGELSEKTAHTKPNAIIFSTERQSARYNPLKFVEEIEDVQDIARNVFPVPQKGDPFWVQMAQSIFASACWEHKDTKSFAEVCQFLCVHSDDEIISSLLASEKMETKILANTVTNLKKEALGGVFAEIRGKLATLAVDKNIQYATSASDFSPSDIENSMIYLQVSEHRLNQYGSLFAIIVGQFLRYLTKREEGKNPPVLVQLDEFPRLGKLSKIVEGLATLRSRNVHLMLVIQSLAQLDSIYGQEERKVIADNCAYKVVLNATDSDTQKYFSNLSGSQTVKVKSVTQSEGLREEQTFSIQEQSVPLIRPEEFGVLQKPILFAYKMRPCELEQAFWDNDVEMKRMVESKKELVLS